MAMEQSSGTNLTVSSTVAGAKMRAEEGGGLQRLCHGLTSWLARRCELKEVVVVMC